MKYNGFLGLGELLLLAWFGWLTGRRIDEHHYAAAGLMTALTAAALVLFARNVFA
jgi:hypothetical protein